MPGVPAYGLFALHLQSVVSRRNYSYSREFMYRPLTSETLQPTNARVTSNSPQRQSAFRIWNVGPKRVRLSTIRWVELAVPPGESVSTATGRACGDCVHWSTPNRLTAAHLRLT